MRRWPAHLRLQESQAPTCISSVRNGSDRATLQGSRGCPSGPIVHLNQIQPDSRFVLSRLHTFLPHPFSVPEDLRVLGFGLGLGLSLLSACTLLGRPSTPQHKGSDGASQGQLQPSRKSTFKFTDTAQLPYSKKFEVLLLMSGCVSQKDAAFGATGCDSALQDPGNPGQHGGRRLLPDIAVANPCMSTHTFTTTCVKVCKRIPACVCVCVRACVEREKKSEREKERERESERGRERKSERETPQPGGGTSAVCLGDGEMLRPLLTPSESIWRLHEASRLMQSRFCGADHSP